MGKQRDLSIEEKTKALAWRVDGVSTKVIGQRLGRSQRSIQRLFLKSGPGLKVNIPVRKPRTGDKKMISQRDLKFLKTIVIKNPTFTAADIKREYPMVFGNLTDRYIQKRLKEDLKMPSRRAAKKPLLTKRMKAQRLDFAKKHAHWTYEDWSEVMFSDESTFKTIRATGKTVRRPVGSDKFDSRFTVKTTKHPDSVMVWGCFSSKMGRGGLFFLPKNQMMNQHVYLEVLTDHLLPFMHIHGTTKFLQDGAPCHKAKKVMKFLEEQPFEIIKWPGNSPDLNPIENAWNFAKDRLKNWDTSSIPKLKAEITKLWVQDISLDYWQKLVMSMPGRLKMVIKKRGDMTKY